MSEGRALVTGAGQRIGRALALELAGRGHDVAVHYATSEMGAREVCGEIEAMGRRAVPLEADLLDDTATRALLPQAAEALGGPITCLVNNASIFERDTIETVTPESWERHIGSNLRAPFWLIQAMALQGLEADRCAQGEPRASGLVVNIIDQRVLRPTPAFTTYSLAKMGLWALTRTTAQALAPAIRVNAIGPGPTLKAARQSEWHFARQRGATILGRGADPADLCAALSFLLSARAVTGQMICPDGGQHLAWETPDVVGSGE